MAVLFVRSAAFPSPRAERVLGPDGIGLLTFVEPWQVGVSDANELNEITVLDVDGLPRVGQVGSDSDSEDDTVYCVSVVAQRDSESPLAFNIQVTWKTIPTNLGKWNVEVAVNGVERTEDAHSDNAGNPIQSSANGPFDPTVKNTFYDETISVKYNTLSVDGNGIAALRGCVSTEVVTLTLSHYGYSRTFPAKTLKLAKADYSCVYGNGPLYFQVSIVLHARSVLSTNVHGVSDGTEMGWTTLVVDRDTCITAVDPDSGDIVRMAAVDGAGNPHTGIIFLDGDGNELPPGSECVLLPFMQPTEADLTPLLEGIG